jgi:hypothetical protein
MAGKIIGQTAAAGRILRKILACPIGSTVKIHMNENVFEGIVRPA